MTPIVDPQYMFGRSLWIDHKYGTTVLTMSFRKESQVTSLDVVYAYKFKASLQANMNFPPVGLIVVRDIDFTGIEVVGWEKSGDKAEAKKWMAKQPTSGIDKKRYPTWEEQYLFLTGKPSLGGLRQFSTPAGPHITTIQGLIANGYNVEYK